MSHLLTTHCVLPLSLFIRIIELNGGQPPLTYKRFQMLISRMDAVEIPAETITAGILSKCRMPTGDNHDERFGVPSLEDLGKIIVLYFFTCLLNYISVRACVFSHTHVYASANS